MKLNVKLQLYNILNWYDIHLFRAYSCRFNSKTTIFTQLFFDPSKEMSDSNPMPKLKYSIRINSPGKLKHR